MERRQITIKVKGKHEGKTGVLNGLQFTEGCAKFSGTERECENMARYFSKTYAAEVAGLGKDAIDPDVRDAIRKDAIEDLKEAERQEIAAELRTAVEDDLRKEITAKIRKKIADELRPTIEGEVRARIKEELIPEIEAELREKILAELNENKTEE